MSMTPLLYHANFSFKDLRDLSFFFGIEVTRNGETLHLSQAKYATDLFHHATLVDCKQVATPMSLVLFYQLMMMLP